MVLERHLVDRIEMSLFRREAVYGQGVSPYDAAGVCQMTDFDDASPHVTWDDTLQANNDVITGKEFPTHQEIPRQSFGMTYTEPRCKPNTIAGLLGLTMGSVFASQRDGSRNAYRHALRLGGATTLPSIAVHVSYDRATIETGFRYYGVKCSSLTLSNNGPYWQLAATLIGSGRRVNDTPNATITPPVAENWVRWGDTRFFMRPLTSGVIVPPTAPTQRAMNLSGGATTGAIEISPYMRSFTVTLNNNLAAESGYRPWSGAYRANFHGTRREITSEITFDVDDAYEARYLDNYFKQYNIALEVDCGSVDVIVAGGVYRWGFQLLFPALRLTRVARGQQDMLDNITYSAIALDDRTNAPMYAWIYNQRPRYLG
jgi:hypothetical protein